MRRQLAHNQWMDEAARKYMSEIGRKGGQVKGQSKARGSRKARAAAVARWEREKANTWRGQTHYTKRVW
jgi:hypothetical protein